MEGRKKSAWVVLFFILTMLFLSFFGFLPLQAQEGLMSEALSIILVVDVSGSMRWTDPDMLRETAANVFIDLLSTEDNLGIVIFDNEAEVVVPLQRVQSVENKERIKNILSPMLQPRGDTDFLTALKTTHVQLSEGDIAGTRPVVVLLTDGDPDPDPARRDDAAFMANYMYELWNQVNRFALDGFPIYTVGFSEEIDPDVIERISIDSKGDYYILNEPGDLLLSFFELLGNLKNRRAFLNETIMLTQEGQSFPFTVNELTRQVNLVTAGTAGENIQFSLVPPQGTLSDVAGVTVENRENYSIGILHQPGEAFWGEWMLNISGSGEVSILGDMDLHVKAWLEEPIPLSKHPLNEPIQFRVAVTGMDQIGDLPVQVDVQVTRPGETAPVTLPLMPEQDIFTGAFEEVNRTGNHEILVRVLMDDEVISTLSTRIYVRRLPSLVTDFWGGGSFRQGEEILITGSLNVSSRRIVEGSDLQLDTFQFVFTDDDGERTIIPLFDSGDLEHGDVRAGDGVYSNLWLFEEVGSFKPSLLAVGRYLEEDFLLEKNMDSFEVHPPGSIAVDMLASDFWSVPGGRIDLPLEIENKSAFRETLYFELQENMGVVSPTFVNLEPGEIRKLRLELSLTENIDISEHALLLSLRADYPMTKTQPSELRSTLNISTPQQAFYRNIQRIFLGAAPILAIILSVFLIVYLGGLLFYRILVYPKAFIGGKLVYEKINGSNSLTETGNTLNLSEKKKNTLIITFNPENKEADYYIEGSSFVYDLIIRALWDIRFPKFYQGWKALLEKHIPIRTFVKCTPPGIMEYNGSIYTQKELIHEDEFESGDFLFKYDNPYGKWFKGENNTGVDVLEEKS